jgi:hypothetical protein
MDVLNFISWLKSKRQVTTVDASQTLIPLGLKDARRSDGYLPGAISVEDLLAGATPPALYDNQNNVFIGENVFNNIVNSNKTGNTAIGATALQNTIGQQNIGVGVDTLLNNTSGNQNIAIGNSALLFNTTGQNNIGLGLVTMLFNTTGYQNIAIGTGSLFSNTTGRDNIAIGVSTGNGNTTGQFNIMIGSDIDNQNFSRCVMLGKQAQATANNQFVIGSAGENVGAIATEALTPTISWAVRINGVNYKIPLQIA